MTEQGNTYSDTVDNLLTELANLDLLNTTAIRTVVNAQITDSTIKTMILGFLTAYDYKKGIR